MADASICLSMQDKISPGMRQIQDNSKPLSKEFDEMASRVDALQKKNEALNKSYADLSAKVVDARNAMRDAKRAYTQDSTDLNRTSFTSAVKNYKELTDQVQSLKNASADTRKEIRSNQQEMRNLENGGGGGGSGDALGFSGLMKGLITAGLGHIVGQTAQQASAYLVSSSFSNESGNIISEALGNAISGGAIGSIIPGIGTAIGAAVGAASGAINGIVKNAGERDNSMQSYAAGTEQTAIQTAQTRETTSAATAQQREQDALSFATLMGSKAEAQSTLSGITKMANKTPYLYGDLTGIAKTLTVYGDKKRTPLLKHLTTIGDTGAALGMSASDMDSVAQILGFMGSSQKLDSMRLKQLRLKGINANQMLASSYGVSSDQFSSMVSSGKISGADSMNRLYDKLSAAFSGMMEKQAQTYQGLNSTLKGLQQNVENAQGKAENEESKKGLQSQINLLSGKTGKEMEKMYSMIGTGKGIQKNMETRIRDEITSGVLRGSKVKDSAIDEKSVAEIKKLNKQYEKAKNAFEHGNQTEKMNAADRMNAIKQKMDILSNDVIDASAVFDKLDANEKGVAKYSQKIASILGAYKDKWTLDESRTKGIVYYVGGKGKGGGALGLTKTGAGDYFEIIGSASKKKTNSSAYGERVVPYDGYEFEAHQGERLLTAEEARRADSGSQISISGNVFYVQDKNDVKAVAKEICRQMQRASQRHQ